MKKALIFLSILMAVTMMVPAQSEEDLFGSSEEDLFGSEDDLFGSEDSLVEEQESSDTDMSELLLVDDEVVRIGGSYNLGFSTGSTIEESNEWNFTPDMSATLYLDARPDADIRFFTKASVNYPFTENEDEDWSFDDIIQINEMFSDFNIGESLFLRAGKQTINWGVGRYFSPADLLNLTEIDPEDPDAELEGPLSVKMHLPVESNNFYLYTVVPEGIEDPSDLIVAPKAEVLIDSTELGVGAYYRYNQAPSAMLTFTSAIGDVDLFGEGVVQYGSDKTFVDEESSVYSLETYDDKLFFKATLGASYMWNHEESDFSISASGQYYYNGEGYDDPTILTDGMGAVFVASSIASEDLAVNDLMESSKHYGAANLTVTLVEDLSFGVFWLGNFNDLSGMLSPSISWQATDYVSLGFSLPWNYGDTGDEYTPDGDNLSFALEVSLGNTSF
jgi:hypothetical protein